MARRLVRTRGVQTSELAFQLDEQRLRRRAADVLPGVCLSGRVRSLARLELTNLGGPIGKRQLVVKHLKDLMTRHPELVIELATSDQPANLSRRDADVSIRLRAPAEPNLVARKLGRVAWGLYAAETYLEERGTPKEGTGLAGHDIVGHGEALAGTVGAKWLREHGGAGRVVLESNALLSQAAAVVEGLGVSTLPCLFGDAEPRLRRLPPGIVGHHDVWIVVHPDVRTSARVRAVTDFFVERITGQAKVLAGQTPRGPKKRPSNAVRASRR